MSRNKYASPHRASQFLPRQWADQVQQLRLLDHSLKFSLPEPLRSHCWPSGIHGNQLTLVTDSSTWATQLRYQQQQILKQINSDLGLSLIKLRVRISSRQVYRKKTWPARKLTQKSADMIRQGALSVPDPDLRAALLKLAETGYSRQKKPSDNSK
jgi:predicted nucleic acid-binding Zn ribbon protein